MKKIEYRGFIADVPDWANWIMYAESGGIGISDFMPFVEVLGWTNTQGGNIKPLTIGGFPCYVDDEIRNQWKESLEPIDKYVIGLHVNDAAMTSALETQVGGSHYKDMKIQPTEYIHANAIGYFEGNVIKYVSRWRGKNGLQDLEKAKHYIEILIELEMQKNG